MAIELDHVVLQRKVRSDQVINLSLASDCKDYILKNNPAHGVIYCT
ncbi:hypothetical protein IT6_02620 [Methylacidiphilum caldifontis]|nr:hypothetical protein [Methylacidiphilum caldifontis]QSR89198.1 hypothetical protein IT6_02620 [Methylacidiphilum caldifontis]